MLKQWPWYIPGATPVEISQRLSSFVHDKDEIISLDFSRFDGSLSPFLRQFARCAYRRYFGNREELEKLLNDEIGAKAVTKFGLAYDVGSSRLSGSPTTTDENTMIAAFYLYCVFNWHSPDVKLDGIPGMVYGDDVLMAGIDEKTLTDVASAMGLRVTYQVIKYGEAVPFLGRYFINPWVTTTSIQDPLRSLGKLHLTTNKTAPLAFCAHSKADGYLVTDGRTPLIREYCLYIKEKHGAVDEAAYAKYLLSSEADIPWWATSNSWPQDEHDGAAMEELMCKLLAISSAELLEIVQSLRAGCVRPLEVYWKPPAIDVILDSGDVLEASPVACEPATTSLQAALAQQSQNATGKAHGKTKRRN